MINDHKHVMSRVGMIVVYTVIHQISNPFTSASYRKMPDDNRLRSGTKIDKMHSTAVSRMYNPMYMISVMIGWISGAEVCVKDVAYYEVIFGRSIFTRETGECLSLMTEVQHIPSGHDKDDDEMIMNKENDRLYRYHCGGGRNRCRLYILCQELHRLVRHHIRLEVVYSEAEHNTIHSDVKCVFTRQFFWPVISADHATAGMIAHNNSTMMINFWNNFIRAVTGSSSDNPLHSSAARQSFVKRSPSGGVTTLLYDCLSMVDELELRRVNDDISRVAVGSRDVVVLSSPSSIQHDGIPSLRSFVGASIDGMSMSLLPNDLPKRRRSKRHDD
eukprot:GHVR01147608.1.p1 GENE.GHVR01147608.1~~GHVR01147608.1.p1  ORF type:complete len:330 (+),score=27.88 GHVR01147608.1:1512-2501(+)